MKATIEAAKDRQSWVDWLKSYGPERFYDSFMRTAQNARGTCIYCHCWIYLDIREGGGVPDWKLEDGDYGCDNSPDTCEEGTGSHKPMMLS